MSDLRPWQPGDPIGCGLVYLPDDDTRAAYGAEVRRQLINNWASYVLAGRNLDVMRARIKKCPAGMQDEVKARVLEIWNSERG